MSNSVKKNAGSSDEFNRLFYNLEPDYTRPLLQIPEEKTSSIRRRLARLYGEERVEDTYREIERIMRVHHAYATPELMKAEAGFDPVQRFTEQDVVLITYGDLIISENRSPLKTLSDFADLFFHGIITTLHILPFYPYSSDRGFSVTSYDEVDPRMGNWDDIAELKSSFKLMFDGVFNHISSKSKWFHDFINGDPAHRNFFIVFSTKTAIDEDRLRLITRPRTSPLLTEFDTINGPRYVWTTFSADQIDLNFKNPEVLLKIMEILLHYVRRGADIIRLDAITYLWHQLGTSCAHLTETHEVVKLFRNVLDVASPHVALITETNVPHKDNITYFGDGHDEAQMVYNFALPPLVFHTFMTGDARTLSRWASTLEPPSNTTAFFNFLDSHDGIGLMGARGILSEDEILEMCERVKKNGGFVSMKTNSDGTESPYELNITWFSALNREGSGEDIDLQVDRFIASRTVALVLRGVPAIYLPSMFGSRNDVEAVYRDGCRRSINRTAIHERRLFEVFGNTDSIPVRIARKYVDLLEIRVAEPAFHPDGSQRVMNLDPGLFSLMRVAPDGGSRVLSLINVTEREVPVDVPLADLDTGDGGLRDLVTGDIMQPEGGTLRLTLKPYQVIWLK